MTELNEAIKSATNKQKTLRKSLLKLAAEMLADKLRAIIPEASKQIAENHKNPQAVGQRSIIQDYQTVITLYDRIEYEIIAVREEILDELNLEYHGEISQAFDNIHTSDGSADRVFFKIENMAKQFEKFADQLSVPRFS